MWKNLQLADPARPLISVTTIRDTDTKALDCISESGDFPLRVNLPDSAPQTPGDKNPHDLSN